MQRLVRILSRPEIHRARTHLSDLSLCGSRVDPAQRNREVPLSSSLGRRTSDSYELYEGINNLASCSLCVYDGAFWDLSGNCPLHPSSARAKDSDQQHFPLYIEVSFASIETTAN